MEIPIELITGGITSNMTIYYYYYKKKCSNAFDEIIRLENFEFIVRGFTTQNHAQMSAKFQKSLCSPPKHWFSDKKQPMTSKISNLKKKHKFGRFPA